MIVGTVSQLRLVSTSTDSLGIGYWLAHPMTCINRDEQSVTAPVVNNIAL